MNNDLLRNAIYYCEALLKRPLHAIIPATVTIIVGLAVMFVLPRTYQADALLMIEAPETSSTLLPTMLTSEQLQFVEQRVLAREKLLALAKEFDLFPGVRETMSDTMLAELIRRHISINTVAAESSDNYSGTSAMRIGFRSNVAEQASSVTARLVEMIIEENRRLRVQRASEMTAFLEREAADHADRAKKRDEEWRAYLAANANSMPARLLALESELQEKEREAAAQTLGLSAITQDIELAEAELRLGIQREEPVALAARQLAEVEADLATRSVSYSPEHPEILLLNQRIESLKARIAQGPAASESVRELSPELTLISERVAIGKRRHDSLTTAQQQTAQRIADLRGILARAPVVQAQVEAFQRERDSTRQAADSLNGRLATARSAERLERAGSISHAQIIERPETPKFPRSPSRKLMLLIVLAIATGAGLVGVYLGDAMRRTIRGSFDLRDTLEGSTLVIIPRWRSEGEDGSFADTILDRLAGIQQHDLTAKA